MRQESQRQNGTRRVLVVSSFVRPVVGGTERFVEFLRDELPGADVEACVVSVAFPGSSADVVVPYRTTPLTTIPLVIPTRAVMSTLLREARRAGLVLLQSADHPLALLAAIAARRTGTRALTVMHGAQTYGHRRSAIGLAARVFDATFPRLVFRLAPPVTLSPSSARFVREEYGLEPALSLPFPLTKLPPVSVGPVRRDGALRVVCASRLSPEKGVDVAIAACSLVDDVELHVYGDGPERPRLERIAADRPWLTLHGAASWDEVIAAQSHAHACISGSHMENVGLAVLEALALGVPVVTTDVGDAAEHLPEGLRWLACPAGRPDLLAEALERLRHSLDAISEQIRAHAQVLRARHAPQRTIDTLVGAM
jgi:glycosyltransferase involved in cell wall biosynthesis